MKIVSRRIEIFAVLLAVVATVFIFGRTISSSPFNYDESDYMYAVSKGLAASYLDRPSISLFDFVKMGVQGGLHSGERQNLSEYIRHKDDITFYRHYHAPLYFYWVSLIRSALGPKELAARWASLLSLLLTALVVYLGTLTLAGHEGRFVGLLTMSFLLMSPTNAETARWATPHSLYATSALATLFCLTKLIQTKSLKFLYGALVCLGLSFVAIEYAPLLLIALLATVLVERKELFGAWPRAQLIRFSLKCALILLLTIAALWPGGLYKLTVIKNYLWYGYYATLASGEYGADSFTRIWLMRLMSSPFEFLLFAVSCLAVYYLFRKRKHLELLPFVFYSGLVFLTTVRNRSVAPEYISSLVPALDVISAFAIGSLLEAHRRTRGAVATLIVAVLALENFFVFYRIVGNRPAPENGRDLTLSRVIYYPDESRPAILGVLREKGVRRERLLVPQEYLSTIHYYFSGADLRGYARPTGKAADHATDQVFERLASDGVDGLVYEGTDYAGLENLLARTWSVRSFVRLEAGRPGMAIAYYQLNSRSVSQVESSCNVAQARPPGSVALPNEQGAPAARGR